MDEELLNMLNDEDRPILVYTDNEDVVQGYCFCIFQQHVDDNVLTDIKTLYIDDLCVDENLRGRHIGTELYEAAVKLAKANDCYNLTLNVWSCNPSAFRFYEKCGFVRSHAIKNFFTDHYDHPIFECGIQLVDMIYLQKKL